MKVLRRVVAILVPLVLLATFTFLKVESKTYRVYVIHTGSMSPTVPTGSAVLVRIGQYHVGQVITFTEEGLTVTHRLVGFTPSGLTITKGDGNPTPDPWHVPRSQIIGGVIWSPPYVGYWIMYFKDPVGLASALLAVLVLWQIWALGAERAEPLAGEAEPAVAVGS